MMHVLTPNANNMIRWDRMSDPSTNHYVNLATVTATLYSTAGVAIAGCLNVAMPHIVSSDGQYIGWLPSTAPLVVGTRYVMQLTATWGALPNIRTGIRRELCIAQYRGFY
jgi:hypothetical protein